jgi:cobalt/nickel transport system permease protein
LTGRGIDPRARVISCLAFVCVVVSVPYEKYWALVGYSIVILTVTVVGGIPLSYLLKRLLAVSPFIFLITLSTLFTQTGDATFSHQLRGAIEGPVLMKALSLAGKALISTAALSILSATTPFEKTTTALQRLGLPSVLAALLNFTWRYFSVLADEAVRMKRAAESRGWRGIWVWQTGTTGRMLGALLIRSQARAERIYAAMLSRGYVGVIARPSPSRIRPVDLAFIACSILIIASIRIFSP